MRCMRDEAALVSNEFCKALSNLIDVAPHATKFLIRHFARNPDLRVSRRNAVQGVRDSLVLPHVAANEPAEGSLKPNHRNRESNRHRLSEETAVAVEVLPRGGEQQPTIRVP